jgi:MFS family permease
VLADVSHTDVKGAPPGVPGYAPAARSGGAYKWVVVAMLWTICFLNNADRQAIFSIFPKLKQQFGFSDVQLGLIGSAFMWVYAFGSPLAGYVGDRLKRKNLILGGCFFWSVIAATTAVCAKLWQFALVRALEGFGETFYFPASMSLISEYHGPATRSKAMSLHQSSVYLGSIAGTWFTALLAEHYGWRVGFYLFGTAGVVLSVVLFAFLREPDRQRVVPAGSIPAGSIPDADPATEPDAGPVILSYGLAEQPLSPAVALAAVFRNPAACLLMLAFVGANFVSTIFMAWTPTFLVEKFHFGLARAGLSGSAFIFLACAASVPVGGVAADYFSRRHAGGRVFVQAGGLLFGATFVYLVGMTTTVSTLLASMVFFGLGKGLYDSNIFASLYDVVEPRARATAAGIMNTAGWAGGAVGPLYVGYVAEHGSRSSIQNMGHAIAAAGFVYVVVAGVLLVTATVYMPRAAARSSIGSGPDL